MYKEYRQESWPIQAHKTRCHFKPTWQGVLTKFRVHKTQCHFEPTWQGVLNKFWVHKNKIDLELHARSIRSAQCIMSWYSAMGTLHTLITVEEIYRLTHPLQINNVKFYQIKFKTRENGLTSVNSSSASSSMSSLIMKSSILKELKECWYHKQFSNSRNSRKS